MRLNQFIAQASKLSRRGADEAIKQGRVKLNGQPAVLGQTIKDTDGVTLDGRPLQAPADFQTIMLNKPVGVVCSRRGQGAKTIYSLLPANLRRLQPVGRLDKDSSGLLIMTSNGNLAHQLTHPSFEKQKVYEVQLARPLSADEEEQISKLGVELEDGPSRLNLKPLGDNRRDWQVTMTEGRNRQIRRSFEALGHQVTKLHRTQFGPYKLGELDSGQHQIIVV